jgi:hypothetical protein
MNPLELPGGVPIIGQSAPDNDLVFLHLSMSMADGRNTWHGDLGIARRIMAVPLGQQEPVALNESLARITAGFQQLASEAFGEYAASIKRMEGHGAAARNGRG